MATTILMVDDEPEIIKVVGSRLKASGYEVIIATDGQTGLEMAKTQKPDLILLDLMLPKMDGYKLCALLKKDARYSKIPVIMFTAKSRDEDRQLAEEVDADAYVTKPFDYKILLDKIQELTAEASA